MDSFMYTNIDFPDVSDDMRERLITSIQSMIYAESAKEALQRSKQLEKEVDDILGNRKKRIENTVQQGTLF